MIDLAARVEACCGIDLESLPTATRTLLSERLRGVDPSAAREVILGLVSVGETMFWRHAEQLERLRATLPRELGAWSADRPLRVWSAGCASGEEVYSLAALFRDLGRSARILGTDLNPRALERAQGGSYGPWSLRRVPAAWTARWLKVQGRAVSVSASLRQDVRFEAHDLSRDPYPPGQDLILCRNVLIYFSPRALSQVFKRIAAALSPGGLLLLAPTDPVPPPTEWAPAADIVGLYRPGQAPARARRSPDSQPSSATAPRRPLERQTPSAPASAPCAPAAAGPGDDDVSEAVWGLAGQGEHGSALEALDAALATRPLAVELWVQRAMIAEEAGLLDLATDAARRACLLAPTEAAPNFWLACCLEAVGETVLAERRLKQVDRALGALAEEDSVAHTGGLCAADLRRLVSALRGQP